MDSHKVIVVLLELFVLGWWATLIYSRRQKEKAKRAEEAKYAAWDIAYKDAIKGGKSEYYALMDAVNAVGGDRMIFKVWEDSYNAAISKGTRKYTAGLQATAAARKAAHQ